MLVPTIQYTTETVYGGIMGFWAAVLFVPLLSVQALPPVAQWPPKAVKDPLGAQTNFALDLLRLANATNPRDAIVLSPLSISMLLSLVMDHTDRCTTEELRSVLSGNTRSGLEILDYFKEILGRVRRQGRKNTLKFLNKMFVRKWAEIGSEFSYIARDKFEMEAIRADFADQNRTARRINNEVAEITNGKIDQIISADDINSATTLILLNAIYFNAKWEHRFDVRDTVLREFHNSGSESKLVPFMRPAEMDDEHSADYQFYQNDFLRCVALPFKGGDMTAYVILPVELYGLDTVLRKFDAATFHEIVDGLQTEKIKLGIPKFNLESEFDVKNLLSGKFRRAFSATYDKISAGVRLDQFKHKATIEVDEEGATAAAASTVEVGFLMDSGSIEFSANQPFLLLLADKSRVIYFEAIVRY